MKTVILGKEGQLGQELCRSIGFGEVVALGRRELDLTNLVAIDKTLEALQADLIINAAAYTAVDGAQSDKTTADMVNHQAPGFIAASAAKQGAWFIHYSTDYVFAGNAKQAYLEDSETGPQCVYGKSKLAGEQAVGNATDRFFIFRTSWVYCKHGHNFLNTVYRLAQERRSLDIVDDQFGSPTTTRAIAVATAKVVERLFSGNIESAKVAGIYHMTCAGTTNWYEFARALLAESKWKDVPVKPIATSAYPTAAPRPHYSVLNNQKLQDVFGIHLPHWTQALAECLEE